MNNDSADSNEKELIIYIYMSQAKAAYRFRVAPSSWVALIDVFEFVKAFKGIGFASFYQLI